jgi:hypothetical protein
MTGTRFWRQSRDGDPVGLAIYRRHYSRYVYRDGRDPALFVGPGQKTVLISHDDDALFVWRKFIDASGQQGVNCAVFRNESENVASEMILDAETWAAERWPGQRLYTYVNPARVRSVNPGYCFKRAGWRTAGQTRGRKPLLVLDKHQSTAGERTDG